MSQPHGIKQIIKNLTHYKKQYAFNSFNSDF